MMSTIISEHFSNDAYRTSVVFTRGNTFRVFCYDCYFEDEKEFFVNTLDEAEELAENWVLYA